MKSLVLIIFFIASSGYATSLDADFFIRSCRKQFAERCEPTKEQLNNLAGNSWLSDYKDIKDGAERYFYNQYQICKLQLNAKFKDGKVTDLFPVLVCLRSSLKEESDVAQEFNSAYKKKFWQISDSGWDLFFDFWNKPLNKQVHLLDAEGSIDSAPSSIENEQYSMTLTQVCKAQFKAASGTWQRQLICFDRVIPFGVQD